MKNFLILAKVVALVGLTFALLELGFLFHESRVDVTPLLAKLGALIQATIAELDAARQTTVDVDDGVSTEVAKIKKPQSKLMKIATGLAEILGKAVL